MTGWPSIYLQHIHRLAEKRELRVLDKMFLLHRQTSRGAAEFISPARKRWEAAAGKAEPLQGRHPQPAPNDRIMGKITTQHVCGEVGRACLCDSLTANGQKLTAR
jgi:hypothetical protein